MVIKLGHIKILKINKKALKKYDDKIILHNSNFYEDGRKIYYGKNLKYDKFL